jgi:hypothetical protein
MLTSMSSTNAYVNRTGQLRPPEASTTASVIPAVKPAQDQVITSATHVYQTQSSRMGCVIAYLTTAEPTVNCTKATAPSSEAPVSAQGLISALLAKQMRISLMTRTPVNAMKDGLVTTALLE